MHRGYVKIWRKVEDWGWYKDSKTVHLFLHLMLKANHKPLTFKGHTIDTGQAVTGLFKMSEDTGISMQSLRTCLGRLKSTNEITIKSTSQFSIITIVNWNTYQAEDITANKQINKRTNKPLTNDQQTTNNEQELEALKELKNIKHIYGEYGHVKLTDEELEKLKVKLNGKLDYWLRTLDEGIEQKGYKYKNHYLAILKWYEKDNSTQVNKPDPDDKYLKLMEL